MPTGTRRMRRTLGTQEMIRISAKAAPSASGTAMPTRPRPRPKVAKRTPAQIVAPQPARVPQIPTLRRRIPPAPAPAPDTAPTSSISSSSVPPALARLVVCSLSINTAKTYASFTPRSQGIFASLPLTMIWPATAVQTAKNSTMAMPATKNSRPTCRPAICQPSTPASPTWTKL